MSARCYVECDCCCETAKKNIETMKQEPGGLISPGITETGPGPLGADPVSLLTFVCVYYLALSAPERNPLLRPSAKTLCSDSPLSAQTPKDYFKIHRC